jgi:hypothetical protein
VALLVTVLPGGWVSAAVPSVLARRAVDAALLVTAGKAVGMTATMSVLLMKGALKAMALMKLKAVAALLLLASAIGIGACISWHRTPSRAPVPGGNSSAAASPTFERFYAGGFRSMRGFEFRGVGVLKNGFNTGGDFMWLNSLEYQIPVAPNDQFYFVGFVDSGTVEQKVETKDYRVSAGVGLRIEVPMLGPAPIALDFGFPVVKEPQDREQVFSFWIGYFS